MATTPKRPVYLNLLQIRQPIGAVTSIVHRLSGFVLVLAIPYALYLLQASLHSPARFEHVRATLGHGAGRLVLLFALWVLIQHFYSGIRHLFMDIDIGVDLPSARRSAWLTFAASVTTTAILGVLL